MKSKWIKVPGGNNEILESEDESFFISYNPSSGESEGLDALTDFANMLGGLAGLDKEFKNRVEETALVKRNKHGAYTYSILDGDFRKQYEYLLPQGYKACLKFYEQNKGEYGSAWSTERRSNDQL